MFGEYTHIDCDRGAHSFCEVDSSGWEICEFCGARRHPARLRAAQVRRRDVVSEMGPFIERAYFYQNCAWCKRQFKKDDMFRVGRDSDHRRVCGPDCPARPPVEPKPKYIVTTTTEVSGRVANERHAINIVKKQARDGYTDKRLSTPTHTVKRNK